MNRPAIPSSKRRGRLRRWLPVLSLLSVALILGSGCVRHESRADLVIVNGAEPETLDPAIITGQPDMRVVSAIFEGLTRLNPKTSGPEPGLAESWDISPDG